MVITLKDVALKAGVNVSTASRALNDSSGISKKTKLLIKNIAMDMNYIPNHTARALAGKGTKSIGVIVPEISSNYFAKVLNYIECELKDKGYSLIVGMTHHKFEDEINYLKVFSARKVDGIIVVGCMYKKLQEQLANIKSNYHIPIVLIQNYIDFPDYDYIMIDDLYGINAAIEHLVKLGHKNIGFIADEISSRMRFAMFKSALKNNGIKLNENYIKIVKEMFELGGYNAMNELLKEKEIPTAIFASYDYIAIGAMKALDEHDLKVPQNMSIIGYDNIRESEYLIPSLSTISPPIKELAKIGIKLLIEKIENKKTTVIQHISVRPDYIIRNTTAEIK